MKRFLKILLLILSPIIIALFLLVFLLVLLWKFKYGLVLKRENDVFSYYYHFKATPFIKISNTKPKKEKPKEKSKEEPKEKPPDTPEKPSKTPKIPKNPIKIWEGIKKSYNEYNDYNIKEIIPPTKLFFKKILKRAAPKKIKGNLTIGLKQPHQTGQALAFIYPIANLIPRNQVDIYGNFENEELSFDILVKGYFRGWQIIFPTLKYIFAKEIRQIIKKILSSARRK